MQKAIITLIAVTLLLSGLCCASMEKLPVPAMDKMTRPVDANEPATYTITVVDQNGDPVPEVFVTFCTDDTCVLVESDEDGMITFEGVPYAYHVSVVEVPEGYDDESVKDLVTEEDIFELTLTVPKL